MNRKYVFSTQKQVHPVFDQLVGALAGDSRTLRKPGRPGAAGALGLVGTLGNPEVSRAEPESDGMQDGSPGAAVVQTRRVDGLGCVKRSACTQEVYPFL